MNITTIGVTPIKSTANDTVRLRDIVRHNEYTPQECKVIEREAGCDLNAPVDHETQMRLHFHETLGEMYCPRKMTYIEWLENEKIMAENGTSVESGLDVVI